MTPSKAALNLGDVAAQALHGINLDGRPIAHKLAARLIAEHFDAACKPLVEAAGALVDAHSYRDILVAKAALRTTLADYRQEKGEKK